MGDKWIRLVRDAKSEKSIQLTYKQVLFVNIWLKIFKFYCMPILFMFEDVYLFYCYKNVLLKPYNGLNIDNPISSPDCYCPYQEILRLIIL